MGKTFQPTAHPVLGLPSPEEAMALGAERFLEVMVRREGIIAKEAADPFGQGWEPPIWELVDALMGMPWIDKAVAERVRRRLGFREPTPVVLINGGNRGGKSTWASKRVMRILRLKQRARAWALHSKQSMSVDYQQPLFWLYMDPNLKGKAIMSSTTYIAFKQKTGFSENKFVLPNLSDCSFLNYEMERATVEGGNLDIIWADELVPPDWVDTMDLRISEKNGWMAVTFTPVNGYTETVRLFQDGAETVLESTAYLVPKDGGEPDPARALGLTEAEFAEVQAAEREGRAARCPQCRPEGFGWLFQEGERDLKDERDGREFEKVPRVLKCVDGKRAVVFFHTADNPYGNPKSVWKTLAPKPKEFIKERFYGIATKVLSARFPKFDLKVHVVAADAVPAMGTNYMKADPASGRNFYMLWGRVTPEATYIYREWPGPYQIPGVGIPGPWAVPDGKKSDGRSGEGQASFGFGLVRYKLEIARLEGWKDWQKAQDALSDVGVSVTGPDREKVVAWDEENGSRENVVRRELDSRFASTPKIEADRPVTLLTEFEDLNLYFDAAVAAGHGQVNEGITLINDALDYNEKATVDFFNKPKLFVSAECPNLIYALRTWTGADGQKGATRDPIEVLRWFFQGENPYEGEGGGAEKVEKKFPWEEY